MAQYTLGQNGEASEIMWDAGMGGGGPYVHCSCGKDHSVPPAEDEENDYESIGYINLGGHVFVHDCDGCKISLARYENFIWENREHIRCYLKTRIEQEKIWADQEHLLNILAGIK